MEQDRLDGPRDLGDGLTLRWATRTDAEELATFNAHVHADDGTADTFVGAWTRAMMIGPHPSVSPADFTVVTDAKRDGAIISSLNLISQTWTYDGIPFGVGRVEAVGTDEQYRRKGLVRTQMAAIHAHSAARGELVQVIGGIPWYYRQFGYDMALDLHGARRLYWPNLPKLADGQTEAYRERPATVEDIGLLAQLYARHCSHSLIARTRNEAEWRYDIGGTRPDSLYYLRFHIIENTAGDPVGYYEGSPFAPRNRYVVNEMAVLPGNPVPPVAAFVCRAIKAEADAWNAANTTQITQISFAFGRTPHPAYAALDQHLDKQIAPYAWYIRVTDLGGFVRHIGPALERRLAGSVMDGYSGTLRLNFYTRNLALTFERGKLTVVAPYTPAFLQDGDALFPDLTFLQLLFGYRSLDDLIYARADCSTRNPTAAVLLDCLFPRRPSAVSALA